MKCVPNLPSTTNTLRTNYKSWPQLKSMTFPKLNMTIFQFPTHRTVGPFSIHLAYSETFFSSFSWWSSKVSDFWSAKLGSSPFLELVEGSSREQMSRYPEFFTWLIIHQPISTIDHHQPSTILSIFILTWKNVRTPDICCTLSLQPMKSLSWCISKLLNNMTSSKIFMFPNKNTWDVQGISWYHFFGAQSWQSCFYPLVNSHSLQLNMAQSK